MCRVRYRDLDGDRHEFNVTGRTKQACEDNAAARWVEIKSDLELVRGRGSTSMGFVAERWLESLEVLAAKGKLAPGTVRQYRSCWNGTLAPLLDDYDVNELTRFQVQMLLHHGLFRRDQHGEYLLDSDSKKIPLRGLQPRQVLGSVLNFAADFGYRRDGLSPLYGTQRPDPEPRAERCDKVLTDEQWEQLLGIAREAATRPRAMPHLFQTLMVMRYTGIRVGEALGVTIEKVDIISNPPTIKVDQKLPESYRVRDDAPLEPTKSRDCRVFVIVPELHEMLVDILAARPGASLKDPLITTRKGTFVTHANLRRSLRDLVARTELDWVHPHSLRRTYLTAAKDLFGEEAAADFAGHEDAATTLRHYVVSDGVEMLDPRQMFAKSAEPTAVADVAPEDVDHPGYGESAPDAREAS